MTMAMEKKGLFGYTILVSFIFNASLPNVDVPRVRAHVHDCVRDMPVSAAVVSVSIPVPGLFSNF